jgi:hypothetical protein
MENNEDNKSIVDVKKELIESEEFETALNTAAEIKNEKISLCKSRNKSNYAQFYELMLASNREIQEILDTKKKNRSDSDNAKVKAFKKDVSQMYRQVTDLLVPEDLEDGVESKIQKMVKKITTVLKMLEYLGNTEIEKEFAKGGIRLEYTKLSEEEMFAQEHIRENFVAIFENGKTIREDMNRNTEEIKTNIYENSVPVDLQFDKSMNPTGLKASDFCKLVDLKSKLILAENDEEKKGKLEEQLTNLASDYTFQNAKNEIMRSKVMSLDEKR